MDYPKWQKLLKDVTEECSLTETLSITLEAKFPRPNDIVPDYLLRKPGKLKDKGLTKDGLSSRFTALFERCDFLTEERYKAKALGRHLNRRYEKDPDLISQEQDSIEPTPIPTNPNPDSKLPLPRQLYGATQIISKIPQWVGRDELLTDLHTDLQHQHHPVLVLHGQGGIGKTSLAIKLLEACGVDRSSSTLPTACVYDNVLYCRVDGTASFDLTTEFLKAFGIAADLAGATAKQVIDTILTRLHQQRWLVVIDNLESLMQDDSAKTKSAEVGDLLDRLAYGGHNSQIIITSRKLPADLHDRRSDTALGNVREILVTGISDADSIKLLEELGMQDNQEDLAWIAGRVKGNVLILNLLAKLYADKPGQLSGEPEWITDTATTIVKKQWEKQCKATQELLQRMCVLRIEMDVDALTKLRLLKSGDGEMESTKEAKKATKELLDGLVKCGLIEENYDRSECKSRYTLHRLIAETLQTIFKDNLEQLWKYASRLYGFFDPPEEFLILEDWRFELEKLHFWWLLGNYEDVTEIVVDSLLPSLRRWGYWNLQKEWLDRVLIHTEGLHYLMCLQMLGDIASKWCKYEEAERLYNQSLKIWTDLADQAGMANSRSLLGDISRKQGKYDEAERLYQQSLDIQTELDDRAGVANSWGGLGFIANRRGKYDEAERLYQKSLDIQTELGNRAGMATSWGGQGNIASKRGNYDQAEELYNQSLRLRTKLGDRVGMATSLRCLGENELRRRNLEAAETWLKKALAAMEDLQITWQIAETNWGLAQLYRIKGDEQTAQAHYLISHKLYTKLGSKGVLERIEKEWL
jgi:tetratricopeptide (TPR) repeat protein